MSERPDALLTRLQRVSPLARGAVIIGAVFAALGSIALVAQAIAVGELVGALFAHTHSSLSSPLALFALASAVRAIAGATGPVLSARVAAPVRRDLRHRLLQVLLERGPRDSRDAEAQLAGRGVEAIEAYLGRYVPALGASVVSPALLIAWMLWRDWLSGVVVLISVALLPVFMALLGAEAKSKMDESFAEQQRLAGYFGDVVRGMGTLKAYNRSSDAVDSLAAVGASLRRTTMATLRVAFLSSFALELLSSLATALVAMLLGLRLLHGHIELALATSVLIVTPEVFLPLRRVAAAYHASATGVGAAEEILGRLGTPSPRGAAGPREFPSLLFRPAGAATREVALGAGEMLVVSGPSGVGKTTLLRSLCTLGELQPGTIDVDGRDLVDIDHEDWRSRVGWLAQDAPLRGRTVRECLSLGDARVSERAMRDALSRVGLDVALEREIGEGEGTLSAGQRRRLGLARCLLRNPLVLVLDEPTSHLDPESAAQVAALIASLPMTRVVASHRELSGDVRLVMGAT